MEPTQLCYALRGLAESFEFFQKKKIELSPSVYRRLPDSDLFSRFGEHPLDVVRINTWKIYSIYILQKVINKSENENELKIELKNISKFEKRSRFQLIKLTAFCDPRIFPDLCAQIPLSQLIRMVVQCGGTQSLAPICGNLLARIFENSKENCIEEIMKCYLELEFEENAQRLFIEVILPKILTGGAEAGEIIIEKCRPFSDPRLTQLAITGMWAKCFCDFFF